MPKIPEKKGERMGRVSGATTPCGHGECGLRTMLPSAAKFGQPEKNSKKRKIDNEAVELRLGIC